MIRFAPFAAQAMRLDKDRQETPMTSILNGLRTRFRICLIVCGMALPFASIAQEQTDIVTTMQKSMEIAIGRDLTDDEASKLADETTAVFARDEAKLAEKLPIIAETAMALRSTRNAAANGIFYDTLRQVLAETFVQYDEPFALQLFVPKDKLVDAHGLGVGIAMSDIYAAAWLRALYEERFDHPSKVELSQDDLKAMIQELMSEYPKLTPPNQQVLSRMNAWAAGVESNWESFSPNERRQATMTSTEEDLPSANVVRKVTGSSDLIKWVAGMDIGISTDLAEKYPNMAKFHTEGRAGEAVLPLLVRLGQADSIAADWSSFQSLQMLQNLNNFYSNNGTMSGMDGTGAMFGTQW